MSTSKTFDSVGVRIIEDPTFINAKYVFEARFIKDNGDYDKTISAAGGNLKELREDLGTRMTVVLSAEDPDDIDKLNEHFREMREF